MGNGQKIRLISSNQDIKKAAFDAAFFAFVGLEIT